MSYICAQIYAYAASKKALVRRRLLYGINEVTKALERQRKDKDARIVRLVIICRDANPQQLTGHIARLAGAQGRGTSCIAHYKLQHSYQAVC
jgi:ribosomal protein L7Ae-like RNA K-turn-binding protein